MKPTIGGGAVVSPLGSALSTLVKWRDAFAAAAAALQPVFDAEANSLPDVAVQALEPSTTRRKALPTGRKSSAPATDAPKTRSGGTDAKVIVRIRELAGKGLSINAIAEKAGVSYPTAKKYAEGYRPLEDDEEESDDEDDEPAPAPRARVQRFTESAARRCGRCQQMSTSNPCANCGAPL